MTMLGWRLGPSRPLAGPTVVIAINLLILGYVVWGRWPVAWWALVPGCLFGLLVALMEIRVLDARRELGTAAGPARTVREIVDAAPAGRLALRIKMVVRVAMVAAFTMMLASMVRYYSGHPHAGQHPQGLWIAYGSLLVAWCGSGLAESVSLIPALRGLKLEG
jgi:hypothetical protein